MRVHSSGPYTGTSVAVGLMGPPMHAPGASSLTSIPMRLPCARANVSTCEIKLTRFRLRYVTPTRMYEASQAYEGSTRKRQCGNHLTREYCVIQLYIHIPLWAVYTYRRSVPLYECTVHTQGHMGVREQGIPQMVRRHRGLASQELAFKREFKNIYEYALPF